jgi:hypothetical protein
MTTPNDRSERPHSEDPLPMTAGDDRSANRDYLPPVASPVRVVTHRVAVVGPVHGHCHTYAVPGAR